MAGLRGIVGIEAAIVLIAFVLVASALAFVAINMGMFSAQKSKEVMAKAYDTATRALDVAGDALAHVSNNTVDEVVLPIKLTGGAAPVDLSKTVVSVMTSAGELDPSLTNSTVVTAQSLANLTPTTVFGNNTNAAIAWVSTVNNNTLLEPGEIVYLVVKPSTSLPAYGWIQIEVKPPIGAPLVVRYSIPAVLTYEWIDLVLGQ